MAVISSPSTISGSISLTDQLPSESTTAVMGVPKESTSGAPNSLNNWMVVPASPVPVSSLPSGVLLIPGGTGATLSTGGVLLASPTEMTSVVEAVLPTPSVLVAVMVCPSTTSGLMSSTLQLPCESTVAVIALPLLSSSASPLSSNSAIVAPGSAVPVNSSPMDVLLIFGAGVLLSTRTVSVAAELLSLSSVLTAVITAPSTMSGLISVILQLPCKSTSAMTGSPLESTSGVPSSSNSVIVVPASPVPVSSLPSAVLLMPGVAGGMLSTGGVLVLSPTSIVLFVEAVFPTTSVLTAVTSCPFTISGSMSKTPQFPCESTIVVTGSPLESSNGLPEAVSNRVIVAPGSAVPVNSVPSDVLLMFGAGVLSSIRMVSVVAELFPLSSVLTAVTMAPSTRSGLISSTDQLPSESTVAVTGTLLESTSGVPTSSNSVMVVPTSPVPDSSSPSPVVLMPGASGGMLSTAGLLSESPTSIVFVVEAMFPASSVLVALTSSPLTRSG